tara:strand:- start:2 stop:217 length:216 start_codon:yes stop_codon:yes gene_type:complete
MYYFSAYGDHQKSLTTVSGVPFGERTQLLLQQKSVAFFITPCKSLTSRFDVPFEVLVLRDPTLVSLSPSHS